MHPHAYITGVVGEVQYGLGPSSLFPGVHFTQIKRGVCSGLHFSVCATAAGAKRNKKNFAGMKILCGSGGVIILDPGNKTATEGANSHVSSIIHPVCNRPLVPQTPFAQMCAMPISKFPAHPSFTHQNNRKEFLF